MTRDKKIGIWIGIPIGFAASILAWMLFIFGYAMIYWN